MAQRVTVPTKTGEIGCVLEVPAGEARGPGVVVLQEYWGINAQIQASARKWADAGFVAMVPDLYHGKLATTAAEAGALMKALDFGKAVAEISSVVDYLRTHARSTGKVLVTGYCLGGALAFATAVNVRGLAAAIPFYGLPGDLDWTKIDAPVQAHFAETDEWATVAGAQKIKDAVTVPMELHTYAAQHAFCNETRPEVYDAACATRAWDRAVAFARAHAK